jgi:hypothetical protein
VRIKELDIARGFTVFIMAAVHAVLIYSTTDVHTSWLGSILFFLAEGPGAPLFMALMGTSFVLSGKSSMKERLKRALVLLFLAYVLNFFKFIIPLAAGAIPPQLLQDFGIPGGSEGAWQLFLLGDILQLAAISLVVLSLLERLPNYHYWAMLLAVIVLVVSPFLWNIHSKQPVLNYIFDLLWGYNARVYFPVFPWLVYPLAGMAAGYYLQTTEGFFVKARNVGILGRFLQDGARRYALLYGFYFPVAVRMPPGGEVHTAQPFLWIADITQQGHHPHLPGTMGAGVLADSIDRIQAIGHSSLVALYGRHYVPGNGNRPEA